MTEQLHFLSLYIYIITVFKITKCQCTSSLLWGEAIALCKHLSHNVSSNLVTRKLQGQDTEVVNTES